MKFSLIHPTPIPCGVVYLLLPSLPERVLRAKGQIPLSRVRKDAGIVPDQKRIGEGGGGGGVVS